MKAMIYEEFGLTPQITSVPDPTPGEEDVIIRVQASGLCRSDWHGWMGHDPDIKKLPHVPGHEFAGIVEEAGKKVKNWKKGDRVTAPFVAACGTCPLCLSDNQQICDNQSQPGFTHWGSFAEYVSIAYADINLVGLPADMDFTTAASLGCRFGTSYRALTARGRVAGGQWVAIHGCGGVGLSAVMIAHALEARVIAIDVDAEVLKLADSLGAENSIDAKSEKDVVGAIFDITGRGAHVSIDALGSATTSVNSFLCLRKLGRHVQIGLLAGKDYRPSIPMDVVIARELQIYGSHGMQAHKYNEMFKLMRSGKLNPERLIGKKIALEDAPLYLEKMGAFGQVGITVINSF